MKTINNYLKENDDTSHTTQGFGSEKLVSTKYHEGVDDEKVEQSREDVKEEIHDKLSGKK